MIPTLRLALAVAILAAASVLAAFRPELRPLVWAGDLVLGGLVVLDFVRAGRPGRLKLRRTVPERVRLAQPFERTLELEGGRAGLACVVHEA